MRPELQLIEIEEVLSRHLSEEQVKTIMQDMMDEAEQCLCAAWSPSECACGAWDSHDPADWEW